MPSDAGRKGLHLLRGLKETLTDPNFPVFEQTVLQYNQALAGLALEVGIDIPGFQIQDEELHSFYGERSGGQRHVLWHEFMPKLNGALSLAEEAIEAATVPSGPPPLPRESLRPVLRDLVEAHYRRPPEVAGSFWATRTDTGFALRPSKDASESVAILSWEQMNQLTDGGFLSRSKNHERQELVRIGEAGFAAFRELLQREEGDKPSGQPIERRSPMNNKVWVIHGHDRKARDVMFALLSAVGLQPLEFDQAAELTGKPSPTIMEILQAAFREGQAFVALFTPDEEATPSATFAETDAPGPHPQPRPNVVFETGMAFAFHPDRTIIVEMGNIRDISDLGGIYTVRWREDTYETRKLILRKLKLAKCPVDDIGDHWVQAGGKYP